MKIDEYKFNNKRSIRSFHAEIFKFWKTNQVEWRAKVFFRVFEIFDSVIFFDFRYFEFQIFMVFFQEVSIFCHQLGNPCLEKSDRFFLIFDFFFKIMILKRYQNFIKIYIQINGKLPYENNKKSSSIIHSILALEVSTKHSLMLLKISRSSCCKRRPKWSQKTSKWSEIE